MENSLRLTVSDIKMIDLALKRKLDHYRKLSLDVKFIPLIDRIILIVDNECNESFMSQSQHPSPEYNGSSYHRSDLGILERELHLYLKFVFQRVKHIPWKKDNSSSRFNSFELFQRFLSLNDFKFVMSSTLKKVLQKIDPHQRVLWVMNLLIGFHYGHECSIFVSIALKLFLKVFHLFPYRFYAEEEDRRTSCGYTSLRLEWFLKIIQKNQCSELILANAMEIFYFHPDINRHFFYNVPDLEYILENLRKTNTRFLKLMNSHDPGRLNNFDLCMTVNYENFATLVKFGASSSYSSKDWAIMKRRGIHSTDFEIMNGGSPIHVYGCFSLRLRQIVRLFLKSELVEKSRCEAEFLLKLLWAAIPDPFLTLEEVENYLNKPINCKELCPNDIDGMSFARFYFHGMPMDETENPASEFLNGMPGDMALKYKLNKFVYPKLAGTTTAARVVQAWWWYKKVLFDEDCPVKSPRSLLHLSRCTVRESLAANFQCPSGIKLLKLPKFLVDYLLMQDCGSNPYEK